VEQKKERRFSGAARGDAAEASLLWGGCAGGASVQRCVRVVGVWMV
jgi:hypothetical protein